MRITVANVALPQLSYFFPHALREFHLDLLEPFVTGFRVRHIQGAKRDNLVALRRQDEHLSPFLVVDRLHEKIFLISQTFIVRARSSLSPRNFHLVLDLFRIRRKEFLSNHLSCFRALISSTAD